MLTDHDVNMLSHELSGSGHWYLDLRDQTVFWSEEIFRMHGCDPGDPQPTMAEALAFYHPDDRKRISAIIDKAIQTREPFTFDARIIRRDGEQCWVRSDGRVKCKDDGEPTWLFGIFRDVTEERREQLHRRRLERAIEQTTEVILMTDTDGRMEWANPAFTRVSGHSPSECFGQKPGDVLQGVDTDPETVAFMARKLAAAEPFSTEVLNYTVGGDPYWLRLSVEPDYDENGTHIGFSSIQSDVTEEKIARIQLQEEVERRKALEVEYRHLATHDALSGLPNRRHFFEYAGAELRRCARYSAPVSLLMIDFDEFKAINDNLGHEAGDKVIEAFALLCKRTLREHDLAARMGGEEFVVLLPGTPVEGARTLAERLRDAFEQLPINISTGTIHVTASMGLAQANTDEDSLKSLIQRADDAMYEAKRAGRNRVREAEVTPGGKLDTAIRADNHAG